MEKEGLLKVGVLTAQKKSLPNFALELFHRIVSNEYMDTNNWIPNPGAWDGQKVTVRIRDQFTDVILVPCFSPDPKFDLSKWIDGFHGFIYCYSISDKSSLDGLAEIHQIITSRYPDRKFSWILAGCDSEKESERQVTLEEAKTVSKSMYSPQEAAAFGENGTHVMECSAVTGDKCSQLVPRVVLDWKFLNPQERKQGGCIVS
eukprot:TRINITY_DN11764_c0_g1_i1.p1 TRINITY_DN11764_c0_g1~~TRINITY_DN11764_c0_g1_i1.p1  ORF type:complete len:212 (-),score=13.43 TRINITY_DN11764_c0_g1_i1:60-668(-)